MNVLLCSKHQRTNQEDLTGIRPGPDQDQTRISSTRTRIKPAKRDSLTGIKEQQIWSCWSSTRNSAQRRRLICLHSGCSMCTCVRVRVRVWACWRCVAMRGLQRAQGRSRCSQFSLAAADHPRPVPALIWPWGCIQQAAALGGGVHIPHQIYARIATISAQPNVRNNPNYAPRN